MPFVSDEGGEFDNNVVLTYLRDMNVAMVFLRSYVNTAERVIEITAHRAATGADSAASDLGREAVHNLARICSASGSRDLARQIVRSLPV